MEGLMIRESLFFFQKIKKKQIVLGAPKKEKSRAGLMIRESLSLLFQKKLKKNKLHDWRIFEIHFFLFF
jgi:hypothetical protein